MELVGREKTVVELVGRKRELWRNWQRGKENYYGTGREENRATVELVRRKRKPQWNW